MSSFITEANQRTNSFDLPEKVQETKSFHDHSNERPLQKDQNDPSQKAYSSPDLLFPREEVERFLGSDDEGQARYEKYLATM
jgi:hypothetical protein